MFGVREKPKHTERLQEETRLAVVNHNKNMDIKWDRKCRVKIPKQAWLELLNINKSSSPAKLPVPVLKEMASNKRN